MSPVTFRAWLSGLTARLAVRLHPGLQLRNDLPAFTFVEDGLGTIHDSSFADAPRFQSAYALGKATGSWYDHDLRWRIHVLLWAATHATTLPGCFVECGVHRGGFARAIIDYTVFGRRGRDYFLFDTFKGFDEAQLTATEEQTVGRNYRYDDCFAEVQRTFVAEPFVKIVRGSVPESLIETGPVAFLSVDMNCAAPEIAAVRYFWTRLVSGAVIVLDDYGFALHREQKIAFDSLAREFGIEILSLPTGQALMFKPA